MPSATSPRRRPRDESDGEAESLRDSQRSTPSTSGKRARTNGYESDGESPAPEVRPVNRHWNGGNNVSEDEDEDHDPNSPDHFQPGALVRVKLTNFVTYGNAEFFPGPSLNMVIGPNGTGKSSLVCAICLGLGQGPNVLGRASQIGEFVKHGLPEAQIEIELQKRPKELHNHVIRLKIIRDSNSREWYLNGRKTSLKAVQELTESFRIQVDNLCQFLPQDKVSEFAGLDPVKLLLATERAAAAPEMIKWHEALKEYRKEQKSLESGFTTDKEHLETLESRQRDLHAEVQKLQERQEIQDKVKILRNTVPFVEYRVALADHHVFKANKREAQKRYEELNASVQPLLQSITDKKEYARRINSVITQRKAALTSAEQEADRKIAEVEGLDDEITANEQKFEAERREQIGRKKEIQKAQRKVMDWQAQLNEPSLKFVAAEWNERIRGKDHEIRDIRAEVTDGEGRERELKGLARENREKKEDAEQELGRFNTQEGRQLNKLEQVSKQASDAWKWVQENQESFEKEVYGPPIISCSLKDPRYANAIESLLRKADFTAFTAQTLNDFVKLSNELHKNRKMTSITIRDAASSPQRDPPTVSTDELQKLGMEGWAINFIDGPTPVLNMLCNSQKLDKAAVTLRDMSEDHFNFVLKDGRIDKFVAGTQSCQVSRRREYGPLAFTTTTRAVNSAKIWTDQPVDTSIRRELEGKVEILEAAYAILKKEAITNKAKLVELRKRISDIEDEKQKLTKEKGELQKEHSRRAALPDKIQLEEEALATKQKASEEFRDRLKILHTQHDHAVLRKSKKALEHKELVEKIRDRHDELLEAQIRHIEAQSDIEGLTARNEGIVQQLEAEEARKNHAEQEARRVSEIAKKALVVCKAILADPEYADDAMPEFSRPPEGLTVDALELEIAAEESKLEYMQSNNPNAIRDYERRQVEVDKLKEKIDATEAKLEKLENRITKIRDRWEPRLDTLINTISEAFSHNFEQIGCAGSVSVNKDEDFNDWSIQIRVKFRPGEDLQILDAHRQSGGERSVSTIFYLMALQSMAQSPFRVVDEINQGMDPRNERMVHERMVEIACQEYTSQYFLITPKLLTGLRYDKRMKVLCIASGEHMPEDYKKLDISSIIGIRRAIMANA
ncbi:related to structural maintenance of chromosomes protein 5 [Phialocephala subalpina]|uniref:Structural maintenance of chromosomes protein 5 n=1 Tax=Phialocephala subalpina TaxID=576137 RepID=A0A1L7WFL6_9HELO|nr:related to structural maintenance of chromosomes protein 5 [Phialocephala subalpina]